MPVPPTPARPVEERLHGDPIVDPYRWLEDGDAPQVRDWVAAQNAHTAEVLGGLPLHERVRRRTDALLSVGTVGLPEPRGQRIFHSRRAPRANQPVLLVRDGLDGPERVLVDPNGADASGLVSLDWWSASPDGRLVAYGLSAGGSEWSDLQVVNADTGEVLPERIPRTRACSIAWLRDGSGFYYTRYPQPGAVPDGEESYHRHVFLHRLGTDWQDDPVVWGPGRPKEDWPSVDLSDDGRWLLISCHQGWTRTEIYLRDEPARGPWVPVLEGVEATAYGQIVGDRLFLRTDLDAPNRRIVVADPANPGPAGWRTVVPERPDRVIEHSWAAAGVLAVATLERASSRLRLYGLDGTERHEVALPELGTVLGLSGEQDGDVVWAQYTSFVRPVSSFRIRPADGDLVPFASGDVPEGVDPSRYGVQQVTATSKDGTAIPMFLVHRHDLPLDGDRPTVLSGYGGFGISRTPQFSALLPLWLDAGGVYAIANLRGGGELGEAWHQAGMLAHKQNVFDDYAACAEWLATNGVTRPERLALMGGSNGGLLVGAALTQRPELAAAVVCAVPLLDMLRYHHFRLARLWIAEYGSSDDPEQYQWLRAYSPYHHVRDGERYPAVLLLTGEEDSRVDPMHARKMAARLQAATGSDRPILLRVEQAAGHGAGKPRGKIVDEAADTWTFLCWRLGVDVV